MAFFGGSETSTVNPEAATIFNGILETQKSTRNAQKFAEMRPK